MIKIDTQGLVKQLEDLEALITRKLEATVRGFAYELSETVIALTPVGSMSKFADRYLARTPPWPQAPGMAVNNWIYTKHGATYRPIADTSAKDSRQNIISGLSTYKLGEFFIIGNDVPYMQLLEEGHSKEQAPQGFMMQAATRVYSVDLKKYFDAQK